MKFCPNCGAQLQDDATFCSGCGANLDPNAAQQQQAPNNQYGYQQAPNYGYQAPAPQPAPKKKKGGLKSLISLLVVVAIIFAAVSIFLPGPKAVAKRAVKAAYEGNYEKLAKYSLFPEEYEGLENEDDATKVKVKVVGVKDADEDELAFVNLAIAMSGGSKEVKKAKIVTLEVTYTYEGETDTDEIDVVVVKQGLQWKVYG